VRQEQPKPSQPSENVVDQRNTAEAGVPKPEPVIQDISAGGDNNDRPESVATAKPDVPVKKTDTENTPVKTIEASAPTPNGSVKQDLPPPTVQKPAEPVSDSTSVKET
jgi:hypothetical protein